MIKTITKRGLSLLMIICMAVSLLPGIGVSAASGSGGSGGSASGGSKVCNVVFEEDFEDNASSLSFTTASTKYTVAQEASETTGKYETGTYDYSVAAKLVEGLEDADIPKLYSLISPLDGMKSKNLVDYSHTEDSDTYGYSVEFSFDWNPTDSSASAPYTQILLSGSATETKYIIGLQYTGGDQYDNETNPSGRAFDILNNSGASIATFSTSSEDETTNLESLLGESIWEEDHIYRVRFVITPFTEVQYDTADVNTADGASGGECAIYVDGVELGTYNYTNAGTRAYLNGICHNSNKPAADYIDNLKITESWDALSADSDNAVKYVNDDLIVTAIRNAESTAASFAAADAKEAAEAAISAAKVLHANTSSTKSQMNTAAEELTEKISKIKNYKYAKVLFEEDFESATQNIAFTGYNETTEVSAAGTVAATVYGQGEKIYTFTNGTMKKYAYSILAGRTPSEPIAQCTYDKAKTNYTVEISMDWNPRDNNAGAPTSRLSVVGTNKKDIDTYATSYDNKTILGIQYTGGDTESSGRKFEITNNSEVVIGTFDTDTLVGLLGEEILDTEHVYRLRFIFKPYATEVESSADVGSAGGNAGGSCTIEVDGVKLGSYEYTSASSRNYISAISHVCTNKNSSTDVIDNVKLVEYWDALSVESEGASKYVNDDALVTAIRNAELTTNGYTYGTDETGGATVAGFAYDNQVIDARAAIAEAKAVFEATDRSQASIDAAVTALNSKMTEIAAYTEEDRNIYNVLYDEDFEDNATDITIADGNLDNDENPQRDYAKGEITAVSDDDPHGYGDYNYKLYGSARDGSTKPGTYEGEYILSETRLGESIKGGVHTTESGTEGYTLDLSFDWNMDDTKTASIALRTKAAETTPQTNWRTFFTVYYYADKGTFEFRNTSGAVETVDIGNVFGMYAKDEDHAYRMRFSIKPYEAVETVGDVSYAGEITVYIDGINIGTYKYYENARFKYFFGMTYYSTSLNEAYIDNIKVMETWDALKANYSDATVEYITDDALIGAIRTAQHKAKLLDDNSVITAETAIADAIQVYENPLRTQEDIDAAAAELKTVMSTLRAIIPVYYTWDGDGGVNQYKEATKYQDAVYGDLHFPSNFVYNATTLDIQWASDKPDVIDTKGNVIRPTENTYVNLTASFTDGSNDEVDYADETFKVRVLAGGDVVTNTNLNSVATATADISPKNSKFMASVTGKAGEYTFTAGGQTVTYTFTENGDFDVIFDLAAGSYTVYQNCEAVATDNITLGSVSNVSVTGVDMTKIIAIDLDVAKAYVSAMTYTDGTYDFGIPTPGSSLTEVTIKARENLEDTSLFAAVYKADGSLFSVCMAEAEANKGDSLTINLPAAVSLPSGDDFDGSVVKVMLWKNDILVPEMPTAIYNVNDLYDERTVIYMMGDSTMCNYSDAYYPMVGWGQAFGNYFDNTEVVVDNRAVGGKTTMWFAERGEFDKIMSQIKPGDYLFMQFAHNDQKAQYGIDETRFKGYLNGFITEAQAKGAIPVLCTSIERRNRSSLGEFPQYMRDVASEKNVMLLEMNTYSDTILDGLTDDESIALYCWVPGTVDGKEITVPYITYDITKLDKYKDGKNDNTHFSEFGANVWANYAAYLLKTNGSGLADSVIDSVTEESTSVETIRTNILSYAAEE